MSVTLLRKVAFLCTGILLSLWFAGRDVAPVLAACPSFPYTVPAGDTASLINAIECANATAAADTINLTNSTYVLTAVYEDFTGLPLIQEAGGKLTINGNGATVTRQTGSPAFRILQLDLLAEAEINDLTLTNGLVDIAHFGGIIYNIGSLTLNRVTVDSGYAGLGGGIYNEIYSTLAMTESTVRLNEADYGGGIYGKDTGTIIIRDSTIAWNDAHYRGGGLLPLGTTFLINSTVSENYAAELGGAIRIGSPADTTDLHIINSTVAGNVGADNVTSGLSIADGTVTIQNTILKNSANYNCDLTVDVILIDNGGNLDSGSTCGFSGAVGQNTNPMLLPLADNGGATMTYALAAGSPAINAGLNAKAVDENNVQLTTDQRGAGFSRINIGTVDIGAYEAACPSFPHTVAAGDTADLIVSIICANESPLNDVINLTSSTYTLTSPYASGIGLPAVNSALFSGTLRINGSGATIERSTAGGTADFRIFTVSSGGSLLLTDMTLSNGSHTTRGGAVLNNGTLSIFESSIRGSAATNGAGVASSGTLTILNSLIAGNVAAEFGGGLELYGGTVKLINSTVSGNRSANQNAGSGAGGIGVYNSTTVAIINSTITDNRARVTARSGIWQANGTLIIQNTIVAGNNGANNCLKTAGIFTDNGNNLDDGTTCAFVGAVGQNTDPMLGLLADNGGPTETHALLAGSPAINAGSNAKAVDHNGAALTTDQRSTGYPRISGGTVDIGAYEANATVLTVTLSLQGRSSPPPHSSYVITVHVNIMPDGGGAAFYSQDFVSNANGVITISNLPTGTYLFSFKGSHTLAREYTLTIVNGANSKTTDLLLEGDGDDQNAVTITDFAILAASFGKTQGMAGYDARADFNGDTAVTILDFSLLAANFGMAGDGGVYP